MIMKEEHNYGIDLLRIVAMFMIVILHVLGRGGILEASENHPFKYCVAWFLEIASYCAVNCYALISGYVGLGKRFKISNIIALWFEVVFYLLSISILFKIFLPNTVNYNQIITSFLPVTQNKYWYFTSYFAVFFFMPFLNYLIEQLSLKQAATLIICCIMIFSVLPVISLGSVFAGDFFVTAYGYSPLWLAILYLVGAYIRRVQDVASNTKIKYLIVYFACVLITFVTKLTIERVECSHEKIYSIRNILFSYNSPTILLAGLFLLLFFSKLKMNKTLSKTVLYFAQTTFGVYIIHLHPNIWNTLDHRFERYIELNICLFVFAILSTAFIIWFGLSVIDRIRIRIFNLLKVRRLSDRLGTALFRMGDRLVKHWLSFFDS